MQLGVQTFTVRREQRRSLRAAYLPLIEMGIRRFEIARIDFSERNALAFKSLSDEYGIEAAAIQVKPKYIVHSVDSIAKFC